MILAQITLIHNYLIFKYLSWPNFCQGLIVPNLINATFIFIIWQFFSNFPKELEEAAAIDGLSRWEPFLRIVLPVAKLALATLAIFVFMGA